MTDPAAAAGRVLAERLGLRVDGSATTRLRLAVQERAHGRGQRPEAYARDLRGDAAELARLVDEVTVQESRFFRDPAHFTLLAELLRERPGPGVVWSAGCANGQEPWSIAMLLEELGATGWRVLATDVSEAAVARARAGTYADAELTGLDAARRARFLRRDSGGWHIVDGLRERVRVQRHALTDEPPAEAQDCPVVFCRNVLIYLLPEHAERALQAIRARMAPDGLLFVGAGEALAPGAGGFVPERRAGAYLYRPAREPARAAPAPPPPPTAPPSPDPAVRRGRRDAAPPDTRLNLELARARLDRRD
jgi:chemotaxis protein methyltransferase CheR